VQAVFPYALLAMVHSLWADRQTDDSHGKSYA